MENLDEVLAKHLLPREARDRRSLVVPLVHKTVRVDAEDRRICCVDERLQLLRHTSLLDLHLLALRDVLPHADHANHRPAHVSSCGGVEQHLDALAVLGVQGELEVGRLAPLERVIENLLDADLILLSDEVLKITKN